MNEAPWFEDFNVGDKFNNVPGITITESHAVAHQMAYGDRLGLSLDWPLSKKVTGSETPLVNSCLVANIAIGLSTIPSQRVLGNLFYRGVSFQRPVFIGDTLRATTQIVALRQNTYKPGRAASGMVVLKINVVNQKNDCVLDFWRCPMIPCRDPGARTGKSDNLDSVSEEINFDQVAGLVPDWNFGEILQKQDPLVAKQKILVEARDTVTLAPEIVRLTLNLAMTHLDSGRGPHGRRLVYGGHTISMAASQVSRVLPGLFMIVCWFHCEHLAPVFEGDVLRTELLVNQVRDHGGYCLLDLSVEVYAERSGSLKNESSEIQVLDWRFAAVSKI